MSTIRYEIDPHNRLVIKKSGKTSRLRKYRKVLDGYFRLGKKSRLIYHIKKSADLDTPQQVKLSGKWSLDKNHNLVLKLDKWSRQYAGGRLILKGAIIQTKGNESVFVLTTKDRQDKHKIYILKFKGQWQVDRNNRIIFAVEKEKDKFDILTFYGAWEVDKNNRIIYSYTKKDLIKGSLRLKTKTKSTHSVVFKGFWDIRNKYRLLYVLSGSSSSRFDLKTSLGVPFVRGDRTALKYEAGIGARRGRYRKQEIILFGKWRIKKGVGLLFEIEYERLNTKAIIFGADVKLDSINRLSFSLKNKKGKSLGITVSLSRKQLSGDASSFLRFILSKEEKAIELGAGFRW